MLAREIRSMKYHNFSRVAIVTALFSCSPQCRRGEQLERLTGSENRRDERKRRQGAFNASTLLPTSKLIQCGLFLIKVPTPQYIVIYVCWRHTIMLS